MNKVKITIIILLVLASSVGLYYFQSQNSELKLNQCINNILETENIKTVQVETKNRQLSPLLTGKISQRKKNKLITLINQQCIILEIQDLIETNAAIETVQSYIHFSIDDVNQIITLDAAFNNQKEFDDVLKSFNDAKTTMKIKHDVKIDPNIKPIDFAITITLLLPTIDLIHVADISIKNEELTLKGIVRDKIREKQLLYKLHKLFDGEFTIINKLELVADSHIEINDLKIDSIPFPNLNIQKNKRL